MDVEQMRSFAEFKLKLVEVKIPWPEITPQSIMEWLDLLTKSIGPSKDLLLTSLMGRTSF